MDSEVKKIAIWGGVLLLIIVGWFFGIFNPINGATGKLYQRKQELLGNLGRDITPQEIQTLEISLDSLKTIYVKKNEKLFPQEELLQLGSFLREIGQDAGLRLVGLTPDYTRIRNFINPAQNVDQFPLEVEYEGPFNGLKRLWDSMETSDYFFKVNGYAIGRVEDMSSDLRIQLRGAMFIKKPDKKDAAS